MSCPLNLAGICVSNDPFPFFAVSEVLTEELADATLAWLATEAPWQLTVASFYEQYEFSLVDVHLPGTLFDLTSKESLDQLRGCFELTFGTKLGFNIDVTAHKLVKGHTIRLHNDYIPGKETYRLLLQLNDGWESKNGGMLLLFHSSSPTDVAKVIPPLHRAAVGFEISPSSHHAVSTIQRGSRYTLVYSFYAA